MQDHIFRKYDIRGIVDKELYSDDVETFGHALAYYFKQQDETIQTVVLGMDGRTHSPLLKKALVSALQASGLDVIFIGICTTPVMYFTLHQLDLSAGVMITASHNEKEYNGFKICCYKEMLEEKDIQEILRCFKNKMTCTVGPQTIGRYTEVLMVNDYVVWLSTAFAHLKHLQLPFVLDCVNGAAGAVIPKLVEHMGWHHCTLLRPEVDGTFPFCAPDPKEPENVRSLTNSIRSTQADFGIAFDGDADRMVPITPRGHVLAGDRVLTLISPYFLEQNPKATVVCDAKCSLMLTETLQRCGGHVHRSATGVAYVKSMMKNTGALLGGELSCHFMFADRYFGYDDGIYAMLRFIEYLVYKQQPLQTLVDALPVTYQSDEIRIPCHEYSKKEIVQRVLMHFKHKTDSTIDTLDGVRIDTPYGWGILRASNTQPVMSFSFESLSAEGFERLKKDFEEALASSCFDQLLVPLDWQSLHWRA